MNYAVPRVLAVLILDSNLNGRLIYFRINNRSSPFISALSCTPMQRIITDNKLARDFMDTVHMLLST